MFLHPLWFFELTMGQVSVEDISIEREIYKGHGYRLHAAKTLGKIVVMKVYQGSRAWQVSFMKINQTYNHIYPDSFIEALLGARQIQPESYV